MKNRHRKKPKVYYFISSCMGDRLYFMYPPLIYTSRVLIDLCYCIFFVYYRQTHDSFLSLELKDKDTKPKNIHDAWMLSTQL